MKLLPLPTLEERQAQTPYHAVGEVNYYCGWPLCAYHAIGAVEVEFDLNGSDSKIKLKVCQEHFNRHFKYYGEEVV